MKPSILVAETLLADRTKLSLRTHDGHFQMRIGGELLMSTTATQSEEQMAELAVVALSGGGTKRVLIGGLGFGFTLRRVLELAPPGVKVQVAELLAVMVSWNREHLQSVNGALVDDPRVEILLEDVFAVLERAPRNHYDAVLLDVDNGPLALVDHGNARLYADRGLKIIARALRPGGRAVFWSGVRDSAFEERLRSAGFRAESLGAKAYRQAKAKTHTLFIGDRER